MPVGTCSSNADVHPGRVVTDNKQTRRSRKQIEEDNARKKAAAIAASKEAEAKHRAAIAKIATVEDSIEQDEEELQVHSTRPDLRHSKSSKKSTSTIPSRGSRYKTSAEPMGSETEDDPGDAGFAVEMMDDDAGPAVEMMDDDVATSPIASTICNSSTSGSGLDEFQDEIRDGSEEIEDANDVAPSGYAARKRAKKARSASLRSDVDAARTIPHAAPLSKKHKESPVKVPTHRGLKRCDAVLLGGLSTNWEGKVKHTPRARGSVASIQVNTEDSNDGFVSGDFHNDKPNEALEHAKASKGTTPQVSRIDQPTSRAASGGGGSFQMGVKLKRVAATMSTGRAPLLEGDRKRSRRQRYMVADLPFPGGSKDLHIWRKTFIPSLLGWAGTQEDPFGANCQMEGEIVNVWRRTFPSIALDKDNRHEIVRSVCDSALNNWRSDIGKAGHHAVTNFWLGDTQSFVLAEDCAEYVSDALTGLCFVYKYPDETNGRGAFCSDLISKVYAKHLRKILPEARGGKYGHQIGGLALATVAVERAFTLFKSGEDISKVDNDDESGRGGTRVSGNGFTDNLWGKRARTLVKSAERLKNSNWTQIQEHATVYLQGADHDHDEETKEDAGGAEAEAMSLHAQIDID